MALSQTQEQIVTGLLLGDGYLEFDKFKASRLQIKQAERKREYVFWLYTHFADKVRTPPKQRLDTRQWYFSTRSLRELEELRNIFYSRGKKVVPQNIFAIFVIIEDEIGSEIGILHAFAEEAIPCTIPIRGTIGPMIRPGDGIVALRRTRLKRIEITRERPPAPPGARCGGPTGAAG